MYKKRHSLVLRIALPFTILLAVTMAALGLYLYGFLQESFLEILRSNLESETRLVADNMAELIPDPASSTSPDLQALGALARRYAGLLEVRVTFIEPGGRVLADSAADAAEMENHLNRPEFQQALKNQVGTEIRYSNTLRTQMLYTAAPVTKNNQVVGAVRLSVSLSAVRRSQTSMLNTILITAAAAGLLTILLGFAVSYYTIYPLRKLSETAQRVASGQTDEIAPTTRVDEIGQLHLSIQQMASHLREQINSLRAEREKLEAVLAHMTDGVIIVDQDGVVQMANEAALGMFLAKDEKAVGRSLIEVVRHHQLVELWRRRLITSEQQTVTLEISPARLFIQGIATPMGATLPGMTLLVFQDLTRVRRLETVRRDFVSNVSHELRTPLTSLKALTETLQESALEDPPAARRFLQRMETEIDNLIQMVNELLELSRIESGRVPLQLTGVSPCEVAGPAIERMALQAERAGLRLIMDCPGDLPAVQADPRRVQQVLVNLIHNAIKFTRPGGEISVSASCDGSFVVFSVRDTGAGIDQEMLPRIFERFFKGDRARSGGGTGLGLSIARHIVEAHGGRIWAESQVERGSTFFFSLPVSRTV